MEASNGRLLPQVREHETDRELVWQVELPATDRVKLSLDGRLLTVRVVHSADEPAPVGVRPEATPV